MILVDVSASLFYGSRTRSKLEVAAEIAAIFAYLALRNNDKVGLILFSDRVELFMPPRKGRGNIWRLIQTVLSHEAHGGKTDLDEAATQYLKMSKRRHLCVLVSDFFFGNQSKSLGHLARKHDLIGIQIHDPSELEAPEAGVVAMRDMESGGTVLVNTSSRRAREALIQEMAARQEQVESLSHKYGFDLLQLRTDQVIEPLQRLFHRRSLKGGRR